MKTLDLDIFEKELIQADNKNDRDILLPVGMDKERFKKFMKLMNCNSPKALASVTLDDIVDLFAYCDEYAECLVDGESMIIARQNAVEKAHSATVNCRRVL